MKKNKPGKSGRARANSAGRRAAQAADQQGKLEQLLDLMNRGQPQAPAVHGMGMSGMFGGIANNAAGVADEVAAVAAPAAPAVGMRLSAEGAAGMNAAKAGLAGAGGAAGTGMLGKLATKAPWLTRALPGVGAGLGALGILSMIPGLLESFGLKDSEAMKQLKLTQQHDKNKTLAAAMLMQEDKAEERRSSRDSKMSALIDRMNMEDQLNRMGDRQVVANAGQRLGRSANPEADIAMKIAALEGMMPGSPDLMMQAGLY